MMLTLLRYTNIFSICNEWQSLAWQFAPFNSAGSYF